MSIEFKATLLDIASVKIIRLPLKSSQELPSRGMVMVQATINGTDFQTPLEPDGKRSHWLEISDDFCQKEGLTLGQSITVTLEPLANWAEPKVPEDLIKALGKAGLLASWNAITTKARWSWIRWIRSTKNLTTRQKRIDVACSKLEKGDKRPCCFDQSKCTVPKVSKNGVLMDD